MIKARAMINRLKCDLISSPIVNVVVGRKGKRRSSKFGRASSTWRRAPQQPPPRHMELTSEFSHWPRAVDKILETPFEGQSIRLLYIQAATVLLQRPPDHAPGGYRRGTRQPHWREPP